MPIEVSQYVLERSSPREFATPVERRESLATTLRLLGERDRCLALLLFVENHSQRRAAAAMNRSAASVARRGRWLRNLFACPTTRAIARAIDTLDPADRALAVEHFFHGDGVSAIAARLRQPRRSVQSRVDFLMGWARGLHRAELQLARAAHDAELDD